MKRTHTHTFEETQNPLKRVKPEPTDTVNTVPINFYHFRCHLDQSERDELSFSEFFQIAAKFGISKENAETLLGVYKNHFIYYVLDEKIILHPERKESRFLIRDDVFAKENILPTEPKNGTVPVVKKEVIEISDDVSFGNGLIHPVKTEMFVDIDRDKTKLDPVKVESLSSLQEVKMPVAPKTALPAFSFRGIRDSLLDIEVEKDRENDWEGFFGDIGGFFTPMVKNTGFAKNWRLISDDPLGAVFSRSRGIIGDPGIRDVQELNKCPPPMGVTIKADNATTFYVGALQQVFKQSPEKTVTEVNNVQSASLHVFKCVSWVVVGPGQKCTAEATGNSGKAATRNSYASLFKKLIDLGRVPQDIVEQSRKWM